MGVLRQVQQFQSIVDFFPTGTTRNKHNFCFLALCLGFDAVTHSHDKNWIIYSFLAQQHYSSPLLLPTEACYSLGWLHFKDTHTQPIISYLHKILGGNYHFYIQYKPGLAGARTTLKTRVHIGAERKCYRRRPSVYKDIPKVSVCTLISTYLNYRRHLSPSQFTCQRSYIVINTVGIRSVALKTLANMCSPWWPVKDVSLAAVIYRLITH